MLLMKPLVRIKSSSSSSIIRIRTGWDVQTMLKLLLRKNDRKCGALIGAAFCKDQTVVFFNYLFADRQSNTRTRVFGLAVESLKYLEYLLRILGLKANAVVLYLDLVEIVVGRKAEDMLFLLREFPRMHLDLCGN